MLNVWLTDLTDYNTATIEVALCGKCVLVTLAEGGTLDQINDVQLCPGPSGSEIFPKAVNRVFFRCDNWLKGEWR